MAVVALFQYGQVRPDVLALLLALRRMGVYVIAVNTGRLEDGGARLPADCYFERVNFGRDFGSYRRGISHLRQIGAQPSRLLLLNDSVFYVARGLEPFLKRLLGSSSDICSATESVEVLPHQTSFCLSFSKACTSSATFARFWRRYLPTELRPLTVLLGEISLSQRLQRAGFSRDVIAARQDVAARVDREPWLAVGAVEGASGPETASWCVSGNLSHRAPAALVELGVPLVKLDLLDRVSMAPEALKKLESGLAPAEGETLRKLLEERAGLSQERTRLERLGASCGLC